MIEHQIKEKGTDSYKYDLLEASTGILLRIPNAKGNKALIEFYLDFEGIAEGYEYWKNKDMEFAEKYRNNYLQVIPIDISFHNQYRSDTSYTIPSKEYTDKYGYNNGFWFGVKELNWWKKESSNSDHSFTLLIRD